MSFVFKCAMHLSINSENEWTLTSILFKFDIVCQAQVSKGGQKTLHISEC